MPEASPKDAPTQSHHDHDTSLVGTLQSLIVAFVLAMTFRGFVVEGFVIPTGSMAPTLMGAHARVHSRQTGYDFAVGLDSGGGINLAAPSTVADPVLGPGFPGSANAPGTLERRMGDRILVLKCLYPFFQPHRFDVVVFKNPTKSQGDEANYIKRLVGLPNEDIWLCDGDVFASPTGQNDFRIQRKPAYVQRAVWQPVHDSDFVPINPERIAEESGRRWLGAPWLGDAAVWDFSANGGRAYRCNSDGQAELQWDAARRELNDWCPYNMLFPPIYQGRAAPVSDVRVCATIVADRPGLTARLELDTRSHIFEFIIGPQTASMRMRPAADQKEPTIDSGAHAITLPPPGHPFTVECWHSDQSMRLFINGREVMEPLTYDWSPVQRLQNATGVFTTDDPVVLLNRGSILAPRLRWVFSGSPLTLQRVRVDRDLYYRRAWLDRNQEQPAYGTHPDNLARLGPDHFMMCGDNSPMSQDSRLWGNPDALVASQIDPHPFLVNRKLLLGKAWVVYFPSPYPVTDGGWPVIPDFGRLRFIR